jgi:hypothetical protein
MKIALCPKCEKWVVIPEGFYGNWFCVHKNITVYNPDPMLSEKLVPFEKIRCKILDKE